jgi:hypothetical protein
VSNNLAVGDVLEVACPAGVGYVAYAGRNDSLGDAVWVVPKVFSQPTDDWSAVFAGLGYFAFYGAHAALRKKLVRKVGYSTDAIRMLPAQRRSSTNVLDDEQPSAWLITEGSTRSVRRNEDLSDEERLLPIAEIWNHPYLVDAISTGWMPP